MCEADPDTLQSLIDKSLLRRREEWGSPRFWMLETIRELAAEEFRAAGEEAELRRRHAEHYLAVALSAHLAADGEGPMRHDLVFPSATTSGLRWRGRLSTASGSWASSSMSRSRTTGRRSPEEGIDWAVTLVAGADRADRPWPRRARSPRSGCDADHVGPARCIGGKLGTGPGDRPSSRRRPGSGDPLASFLGHCNGGDTRRGRKLAEESLAGHRRAGPFPKGEAQPLTSLAWAERRRATLSGRSSCCARPGPWPRRGCPLVGGRHPREHRCAVARARQLDDARRARARRSRCQRDA